MSVRAVEEAISRRARAVLGHAVHVDVVPGSLDLDAQLGSRLRRLPAVFVAFMGGQQRATNGVMLDADFVVLVVTGGVAETSRRESEGVGAIPILERLLPALHGHRIDGVGSLVLRSVANLFAPDLDTRGITIYSAAYTVPVPMEMTDDPAWTATIGAPAPVDGRGAPLPGLETIHGDWSVPGAVAPTADLPLAEPLATETVALPGADR